MAVEVARIGRGTDAAAASPAVAVPSGQLRGVDGFGSGGVGDLLGVPPQPVLDDEHEPEEDGREEDGHLEGGHPAIATEAPGVDRLGHGAGVAGVGMLSALLFAAA